MSNAYQVIGTNAAAPFTLKVHRGDGMALLAMDWRAGKPPKDFVGFAIECKEPGAGKKFEAVKNRIQFDGPPSATTKDRVSSLEAPFQTFRWVHFPRTAELNGAFTYRITPVFMDAQDRITHGPAQEAAIELARETYAGKLNVAFTRGFIASQAFVDYYCKTNDELKTLLPPKADQGLAFTPTHPKAKQAMEWMGFEARSAVLELLDEAIADKNAQVRVVAYDLNQPELLTRLEQLGGRLRIIIDDDGKHGEAHSPESKAAKRLRATAGAANVLRQHMGKLQHNKTIVVQGPKVKAALCGSTNFTWRGLYVQNNHAVVMRGASVAKLFMQAFDDYWASGGKPGTFGKTASAGWNDLGLAGIDARITFSPRTASKAVLQGIADDIGKAKGSLFYSLAFLYQTPGAVVKAIDKLQDANKVFSFGVSDHEVGVLRITKPSGLVRVVYPAALGKGLPAPFKPELTGGGGNRMHHKFVVIDFDQPSARVYFGSFNFSGAADTSNGENLVLVKDRRIATSFMIEAVRIYDHYNFRVKSAADKKKRGTKDRFTLQRPPRQAGEKPWWDKFYTDPVRVRDRETFR